MSQSTDIVEVTENYRIRALPVKNDDTEPIRYVLESTHVNSVRYTSSEDLGVVRRTMIQLIDHDARNIR